MILDRWDSLGRYAGLGANFETAVQYLLERGMDAFAPGKYAVDGERVYISVREADLSAKPERWEAHRRYADIQILLAGGEAILYAPEPGAPEGAYNEAKDVEFFESTAGLRCALKPGDFMIFLPGEPHAPDRPEGSEGFSRKMVVKVLMA
jgi:YhcH/YjgK/YiaL family protein